MQTSKLSVVICALMACAPLTLRATDTPAQAAARAQVEAKLREIEAQSPETNQVAPAMRAAPPVVATPMPAPTMTAVAAPPSLSAADLAQQKKAAAAQAKAKAKADKAAARLKAKQDAEQAKKDAAMARARKEVPPPAPKPAAPTVTASKADVGNLIGLQQSTAPALPISGSKEMRLQALLQKYQSDQVSPEEYHKQRAAILAEP